jgi:hypothetical protein
MNILDFIIKKVVFASLDWIDWNRTLGLPVTDSKSMSLLQKSKEG